MTHAPTINDLFDGEYYQVSKAIMNPEPLPRPRPQHDQRLDTLPLNNTFKTRIDLK